MKKAFDAWAAQFENPPSWRPALTEHNGHVFLDGLPLPENKITATVEPEAVILMGDLYCTRVEIDWPFEGPPAIAGLYISKV